MTPELQRGLCWGISVSLLLWLLIAMLASVLLRYL